MLRITLAFSLFVGTIVGAAEKAEVSVSPCKAFSIKGGRLEFAWTNKNSKPPTTISDFAKTTTLDTAEKYDLNFATKGGIKVKVLAGWQPKAGANSIQLSDYLGTVYVTGDGLPKVDSIVVTSESDPGPGEKGHTPIQRVADYKDDIIAPAGFYSVWIVPANGSKAQRIADRIRVQAGRETRVGE